MKHIWICQCGESGLGVEDYVKHMYLYAELDETIRQDEERKEFKKTSEITEDERDQKSKLLEFSKKHLKKALKKGKR